MRSLRLSALALLAVAAAGVVVACSSSGAAPGGDRLCTPGNYVFCRCEDRSEGTKLCKEDGQTFEACQCGAGAAGDPQGGLGAGPLEQVDGGAPTSGPSIDAACAGKLGVVAGADDDLDAYVAAYQGKGVFAVSKSHGPGLRGTATVLPVGGALVATYPSRFGLVAWTKYEAGAWSAPVSVGSAATAGATTATVYNGDLKLFYLGQDGSYHVGTYKASGWDDATAPAGRATPDGGAPVSGASAPAAVSTGNAMIVFAAGDDGSLARAEYSYGAWGSWIEAPEGAFGSAPVATALEPGADDDTLLVWGGKDLLLHAASRSAQGHTWSNGVVLDNAASATEAALASLEDGDALVVWRGSNDQGYFSVWSPKANGFSPPAELVPGANPELASLPSLTRGRCGSAATLAYADKATGKVEILRYEGGAWKGPFEVGGIPKASWVGVGELP